MPSKPAKIMGEDDEINPYSAFNDSTSVIRIPRTDIPYRTADGPKSIQDIVIKYTENRLTLCQAVAALVTGVFVTGRGHSEAALSIEALNHLGHRFHSDDVAKIELGFDGFVVKWFDEGNRPVGWFCLFKDNYEWYKDPQMVKS